MSSPIPIALCGKNPEIVEFFKKGVQPEYEVVQHCVSVEDAVTGLPAALKGERSSTKPFVAIVVGGGFAPAELAEMRAVEGLGHLPWLYPSVANISNQSGPPPMPAIVAGAKRVLREIGLVEGYAASDVKAGVYDYAKKEAS